ncbi:hypothetical protein JCM16303_001386 [Sporobolomyces ruberrimus]
MSGISTSSSDSHEFILVPTEPARSNLVTVAPRRSPPSTFSTSEAAPHPFPPLPAAGPPVPPSSPPRTHRRLVKRSHASEESRPPSPPTVPSTPPNPHLAGHSRRGSASPGGSSPRERSPPIIAPHESLVGDVQMSMIPLECPSAPAASARVRDAEITLRFLSSQGQMPPPIIKAITPTSMGIGPSTSITDTQSMTAGLHLGYTSAGTLELTRTASKSFTHQTQARISSSGVETNELWLTVREDPTSRQGIPGTVDFAALIRLNSDPPFEAELSVGVTIGRGPQALLKMLSSPQEWIALYDGTTTLNPLRLSTPTTSKFVRPTGLVADDGGGGGGADVEMGGQSQVREEIRVVKRKPSALEC